MSMPNKPATETAEVMPATPTLLPYQTMTDEGEVKDIYKYLEGHPRQYRFDAKDGSFNINGDTRSSFKSLVFQPIAWRIFTDNILNMGTKNWAELFFIDEKNCVSAVLFHGYSVDNIFRLIEPLYYDDLTLADVVITAIPEKKENAKIQPKGVYYIANFTYTMAEPEISQAGKLYARDRRIFRQETLTDIANIKTAMNYYNPFAQGEPVDALPDGVTRKEIAGAVENHYAESEEPQTEA